MTRGFTRAERLREMERLYVQHSFSDIEMAERLGVNRTTVWDDRLLLESEVPFVKDADGRHRIDRNRYLSAIRVNLHEALALYLAARRMSRQTRIAQPHIAEALSKLAGALRQPMTERLIKAADNILAQNAAPQRTAILETVAKAWVENRKVEITYSALQSISPRVHVVYPYLIEPSLWSDSNYVIAFSEQMDKVVPFKTERILEAHLRGETFNLPADFDEETLLRHAWGVWYSESEPIRVRLRFAPGPAADRVRESIWHPLQKTEDTPEGGCIWAVAVDEWREMLPWVRGWGADVEVLEPSALRRELARTAVLLNKLYPTVTTSKLPYQLPYAKTNPDHPQEIHLLLYHLIDVGQVALLIWQEVLTDSIREQLAAMLNLSVAQAGQFVAFLASLHDLGKAGPAYQKKYAPNWLAKELQDAGLGLVGNGKAYDPQTPHAIVSTWALKELLPQMLRLDEKFAYQIAVALGGHHGSWPPPGAIEDIKDQDRYPLWSQVRRELVGELQTVFQPPTDVTPPANHTDLNTFLTIFSGLVSVADWLGSRNKECFDFIEQPLLTRQYAARALQKAKESLADLGWLGWQPDGRSLSFLEAFAYLPDIKAPRGVQAEVIAAAGDMVLPALIILEAPTGIGKTEAAVYLANHWLQAHKGRGLYVAMPTQATSNQIYGRIGDFLNHHYADMSVNYHLVHGQAGWLDELKEKVELQSIGDDKDGKAGVQAESWFAPRKRTLLAPFGVGTVDQTFMSILQTRHFFVRLFGLSHKVVIFDEVHAYDTFMSTLFHRLLEWLSAIGASVIILSATLPAKTRRELMQAYTRTELPEAVNSKPVAYPTLTIAAPNAAPRTIELTKPEDVPLYLSWDVGRAPEDLLAYLQEKLVKGGCAAIICNTVRRAQEIYHILDEARRHGTLDIEPDNLVLFHARFPPVWRRQIEQTVLHKFGKNGDRPPKAIVVATQVIEQSLDLDFDLMITDLAPIDLIIQRAGRLHRHRRSERHGHERRLLITQPAYHETGLPDFGKDVYVYERYILLRSFLTLRHQSTLLLPGLTTALIESVYGASFQDDDLPSVWQEALRAAAVEMAANQHKAESKASHQLVLSPHNRRLLKQRNENLDEESPDVHETLRAQTRDIDPGIALICLHQEGDMVYIHARDGKILIDLEESVPPNLIKQLQQNAITVQHKAVVHHFAPQLPPANWQKQAALRHCRPALFTHGIYDNMEKYTLRLTQALGLEIIEKENV